MDTRIEGDTFDLLCNNDYYPEVICQVKRYLKKDISFDILKENIRGIAFEGFNIPSDRAFILELGFQRIDWDLVVRHVVDELKHDIRESV